MRLLTLADLRSPAVTRGSVHVRARTSLRGVMATIVLAALPCALVGLYNTGYQANAGLARLGEKAPGGWRSDLLTGLGIACDPGAVLDCVLHGALYLLPVLAVAWATGYAWEHLFARARGRPRVEGLLATALIFTLLLHPATPWWQVALGMSFATVFAKELFGGTGMGFVCAPAAGVAFLALAWPDTLVGAAVWPGLSGHGGTAVFQDVAARGVEALERAGITGWHALLGRVPGALGATSALACVLGAAVLVLRGVASWRVVIGVLLGALTATLLLGGGTGAAGQLGWAWHVVLGSFAFGAVFLAADPTTAPMTHAGRWLLGLLVGFVIVLIRIANPLHPDGVVFAVLFGNVFAPLLDSGVVACHAWRRRRRSAHAA